MICAREGCNVKFKPAVHNQKYHDQKCKRRGESDRKRVGLERPTGIEQQWELEELRKETNALLAMEKSDYLLANKSFAMFDLESTHMDADFGRLICACIKPLGEEPIVYSTLKGDTIVEFVRDELQKYDYIVTYYGTGFDIPFLTTRLIKNGLEPLGLVRQVDMYYTARAKLKLASNRQANVVKSLTRKVERTDVVGEIWLRAAEGDKEAVKYIVEHCIADVHDLEEVFNWLVSYRNLGATPIRSY